LSIPPDIEGFFRHGIGLDGSSIRGFAHIDDSDLLLLPDRTTAKTVPIFKERERMSGTGIADVYKGFEQVRLNTNRPISLSMRGTTSRICMIQQCWREKLTQTFLQTRIC
jgi:glutamine synthetase